MSSCEWAFPRTLALVRTGRIGNDVQRHGEGAPGRRGRVVIFEPESGGLPQGSFRTVADVTRTLLRAGSGLKVTPSLSRRSSAS